MNSPVGKKIQNNPEIIRLVIPGNPVPLQRPRMTNHHVYDAQKHEKLCARNCITAQYLDDFEEPTLIEGPVHLEIDFHFLKGKRGKQSTGDPHIFKPDISNCIKFIEDVLTNLIYKDDCVIASLISRKIYDQEAKTVIIIKRI